MTTLQTKTSGNYTVSIFSESFTLNNGKHVTEYTVVKMHDQKLDHYGNSQRTYKRLETAQKRYTEL